MKPILPYVIVLSLSIGLSAAQDIDPFQDESTSASGQDVAAAVDQPNDEAASGEVDAEPADDENTDASPEESAEPTDDQSSQEPEAASDSTPSVESAQEESAESEPAPVEDDPAEPLQVQPTPPEPGMAVRVERIQGVHTAVDPSSVKLHAPFPAKLLAQVPEGWRIEKSDRAPAFSREVELAPGSRITLAVKPHVLIPEADGASVFAVPEPGYDASLGYQQNATVGAILATSIRQLEDDSLHLGAAIDQLQQLLVSLPKPEPAPLDQPAPNRQR